MTRRHSVIIVTALAGLLVLPTATVQARTSAPASTSYGQHLPDGRPNSANPLVSYLPAGAEPETGAWRRYAREASAERTAQLQAEAPRQGRALSRTVSLTESEPVGTTGGNDTPATADPVAGFGTGSDDPAALISGDLAAPDLIAPATLPAPGEDDGSITLATDTGLTLGAAVRYANAQIGDGPYGSGGTGSGDFDVYAVTANAGDALIVDIDAFIDGSPLDSYVIVFDSSGNYVTEADGDDVDFYDAFLSYDVSVSDTYYIAIGGWFSFLDDPFDSSSGTGADSEGPYAVTIALATSDRDVFAVDLEVGDVLGATVLDFAASVAAIAPDGTTLMQKSFDDASFIYGAGSPLEGGGAHLAVIADQAGTYYVSVQNGVGPYDLRLQAFRPGVERFREGRSSVLFLDFDGGVVPNADALWGGFRNASLSPLSAFLDGWSLPPSAEDDVIDAIVASVKENIENDLRTASNGDYDTSGTPGEFDVTILNSRDDPDPFGSPNVSRVIIGGTISELGIDTIGIAQSIDPGNYATNESAVVLLDLLSEPGCSFGVSLNCFVGPSTDMVELVGTGVGNIAAHEAGHFIGSFHTEQFNAFAGIMDQGGNLPGTIGVGDDGEFGTADDEDVDFIVDEFALFEGFQGMEDTRDISAFGQSTGRDTVNDAPTASTDSFEFTGGPLTILPPGVLANDTDPEFDALTATLGEDAATGSVTIGGTGGFVFTPTEFGPTSFTYSASDGDLSSDPVAVDIIVRCGTAVGQLQNPSFEVGMSRWCRDDSSSQYPWTATGPGEAIWIPLAGDDFGFFLTEPTDGDLAAVAAWDGAGSDLVLSQFLRVPDLALTASFSFDWRAAWDLQSFCFECENRELSVVILDALTGEELDPLSVAVAEAGTIETDTGGDTFTVDLLPYVGRHLKVEIRASVPEFYTGPGVVQIDNVQFAPDLDDAPVAVGDAYAVAVGGTLTVPANKGVLANDTDDEGDTLTAELVTGPVFGALALEDDGSFVYTHGGSANLLDTFTYLTRDARSASNITVVTIRVGDDGVIRLAGENRIETAVAISQSTYPVALSARAAGDPQASAVVLARADDFADGLAGTPFAASQDAPLLLTYPDSLHPTTEAEIKRVLPEGSTVYILGGRIAIDPSVAAALRELGYKTRRIAGDDRYDTAVEVAGWLGNVSNVLVARGDLFADALAAGPASIVSHGAIVLTRPEEATDVTTAYLAEHPDATVYGVGGPAARAYPDAEQLIGPTRHETAVLIANEFFDDPAAVGIARSDTFPDALAGGVHVGRAGGPILLTPSTTLDSAAFAWLDTRADNVRVAFAYGGPVALSDDVVTAVGLRIR